MNVGKKVERKPNREKEEGENNIWSFICLIALHGRKNKTQVSDFMTKKSRLHHKFFHVGKGDLTSLHCGDIPT